jgi:hypothetical protein
VPASNPDVVAVIAVMAAVRVMVAAMAVVVVVVATTAKNARVAKEVIERNPGSKDQRSLERRKNRGNHNPRPASHAVNAARSPPTSSAVRVRQNRNNKSGRIRLQMLTSLARYLS